MIWQLALTGIIGITVGISIGVRLAAARARQGEWLRAWAEHIANPDDECCWQAAYPECYPETVAELGGDGDMTAQEWVDAVRANLDTFKRDCAAVGRDMGAAKQDMGAARSEGV